MRIASNLARIASIIRGIASVSSRYCINYLVYLKNLCLKCGNRLVYDAREPSPCITRQCTSLQQGEYPDKGGEEGMQDEFARGRPRNHGGTFGYP